MKKSDISYVMNILRQGTITWSGRQNALIKSRKQVEEGRTKTGKVKYKYYYQCANCKEWFRDVSFMEVDHIVEVGGFKGSWDLIVSRMFDEDNLQVLDRVCHAKKTSGYNASLRYSRK